MAQQVFLQWNVRSVFHKKHDLIFLINKYTPIVFSIAETWLTPSLSFHIPQYNIIRCDRADGYGGSALLISNRLPLLPIPISPSIEGMNIVAAQVKGITVLSVYIAHPQLSFLSVLRSVLQGLSGPILVMGDFNSHHFRWGSPRCDPCGEGLVEILDDLNLCILNSGCSTRRTLPGQQSSCLDLTFCSPDIAISASWLCSSSTHGSDHYPIVISVSGRTHLENGQPPLLKFNLSQPDWSQYSFVLDNKINLLPNINDHDQLLPSHAQACCQEFIGAINSSAEATFPVRNGARGKIPSPPWWDPDCTRAVKERKEAERSYNRNMSVENILIYKRVAAKTRRLLRKKKRNGWHNFCSSLTPATPSTVVWKNIKRFRSGCCPSSQSALTQETAELFFDKIAPPYVPSFREVFQPPVGPSDDPLDEPFTFKELKLVLKHVKDSSPGLDGIPYSFISHAGSSSKNYFLSILNYCYINGWVPNEWKCQIIIPILKPGQHPADPNSYRPIALSSVLLKLLEHLIKNRLVWIVESQHLLPNSQFGFRKGYCTMDSVGTLLSDIRTSLSNKDSVVAAFLDISSAYDSVILPILRQKMQQLRLPAKMTYCICEMLMSRSLILRTHGMTLERRFSWKGLPHGSVLSPIL